MNKEEIFEELRDKCDIEGFEYAMENCSKEACEVDDDLKTLIEEYLGLSRQIKDTIGIEDY